ncbi:MAG: RNA methyltransferase [Trichococcus flocculiformis]|jgi:TrmH family RNA methyltransferase|uniref:RNA methyltransferase, TrmH family n=1 Tax=Trichococcus flocculiformis TaxID=82803 RepID=A0AB38BLI9_9LACT|nr:MULTISPECIES: RNA methyltransferase [Trichococcus]CZR00868.1 trna/rrna methyltransferase spou type [Trichococcus flocculiformis]SFI19006.1 RNA methyltransferase, TrmH family [Trichococcus flocculiformis]
MEKIASMKNQKVKQWKKLQTTKGRKEAGAYLIEGTHLLKEAIKANASIQEVLMTEAFHQQSDLPLGERDIIIVSQEILASLAQTETPQGVVAIVQFPEAAPILDYKGKYILLDQVQDPGNVGTIIRTADAAGYAGVILGEGSVDLYNDKVLRSMQGSHFHLPVYRGDLQEMIPEFKKNGIPVYGTELNEAAVDYRTVFPTDAVALVLGNEGNGVSGKILALTDQNLYIPIFGEAESLNVAVAAGILLYHFVG